MPLQAARHEAGRKLEEAFRKRRWFIYILNLPFLVWAWLEVLVFLPPIGCGGGFSVCSFAMPLVMQYAVWTEYTYCAYLEGVRKWDADHGLEATPQ